MFVFIKICHNLLLKQYKLGLAKYQMIHMKHEKVTLN